MKRSYNKKSGANCLRASRGCSAFRLIEDALDRSKLDGDKLKRLDSLYLSGCRLLEQGDEGGARKMYAQIAAEDPTYDPVSRGFSHKSPRSAAIWQFGIERSNFSFTRANEMFRRIASR